MKVKTSTVVVESFVSDDGLEFNTKDECLEHEQDIAFAKSKEIVDKLPHFIYCPLPAKIDRKKVKKTE